MKNMNNAEDVKKCYTCRQTLNLTEFDPSPRSKDGWRVRCKKCHLANCEKEPKNKNKGRKVSPLKESDLASWIKELLFGMIRKSFRGITASKSQKRIILDYTIEELIIYLQSQMEPWMTWKNYGAFLGSNFSPKDQTSWTWHIVQTISIKDFPYISTTDKNFQLCWSLDNLHPINTAIIKGKMPKNPDNRICSTCQMEKSADEFLKDSKRCKECKAEYYKAYEQKNKEILGTKRRKRRKENIDTVRKNGSKYQRERRAKNTFVRIRQSISRAINRILAQNGASKEGESCSKYLPFTRKEFERHMEAYFLLPGNEWMNWNNHGCFRANAWNDNDPSTWKWQLDHIIPQSEFPFSSMKDESLKKAWSLSNLRPLSAKQNIIDGANRTRHTKKNGK